MKSSSDTTLRYVEILRQKGLIAEVMGILERGVEADPSSFELLQELAATLVQMGRRLDAATCALRALRLNCELSQSRHILTECFEAMASAAVAAFPDSDNGELETAAELIPDSARKWYWMGRWKVVTGDVAAAKSFFIQGLKRDETDRNCWGAFLEAATGAGISPAELTEAEGILADAITHHSSHEQLHRFAEALLHHHPAIVVLAGQEPGHAGRALDAGRLEPLFQDRLILTLLQSTTILADPGLERVFTLLRRALLLKALADSSYPQSGSAQFDFVCSLGLLCFSNSFVFGMTDQEQTEVALLRQEAVTLLQKGCAEWGLLALLAMYMPIHRLMSAPGIVDLPTGHSPSLQRLLLRHVVEPHEEALLAEQLPAISEIEGATSLAVRRQYEEDPYPCWRDLHHSPPCRMDDYFRSLYPGIEIADGILSGSPQILVAGCGTGRHAIGTAKTFANCTVVAVDLSRASLAYALSKARKFGVENIRFAQADILKLGAITDRFDLIECAGVLHHLGDPMAGWQVLTQLLKPEGFMGIGLYSRHARKAVNVVRELIRERGYSPIAEDIRKCRADIMAMEDGSQARELLFSADFYSLHGCRDLIFHVQEHQVDIPWIQAALEELGLEFLGFRMSREGADMFRKMFGPGIPIDSLPHWNELEQRDTSIFSGMYQFWVRKPR